MTVADRIHRDAQLRLQNVYGRAVAGVLGAVGLERTPVVRETYRRTTSRLVAAGQRQSAQMALAYMAAYAPFRESPDVGRALDGRLLEPDSEGAIVGLLRLWSLLDQEVPELEARSAAGTYAANLAEGDLQSAMRGGLDEAARASGQRPSWRKEPSDGACAWCEEVAAEGAVYDSADDVPFHGSDRCAVAPEYD